MPPRTPSRPVRLVGLTAGAVAVLTTATLAVTAPSTGAPSLRPGECGTDRLGATLLTEVTEKGERIVGVELSYPDRLFSASNLVAAFRVTATMQGPDGSRSVERRVLAAATVASRDAGSCRVLLQLDAADDLADPYRYERIETQHSYRQRDASGAVVTGPIRQTQTIPVAHGAALRYTIEQRGVLTRADGGEVAPGETGVTGEQLRSNHLDTFTRERYVDPSRPERAMAYRLHVPASRAGRVPLVVFLHGSGQFGNDNLAHVISSKGAVAPLLHGHRAVVVAPQVDAIFDPLDEGIYWQSGNRIDLVNRIVDDVIARNPQVDRRRIYVQGLSRGGEGALALLLSRPERYAAGVIMSGREAGSTEWVDGLATPELLRPLRKTPLWFFHAAPDPVAPVAGTRRNVTLLRDELGSRVVRYTEFSHAAVGDNGYVNSSAHNSWDAVYNAADVWEWLFDQRLRAR